MKYFADILAGRVHYCSAHNTQISTKLLHYLWPRTNPNRKKNFRPLKAPPSSQRKNSRFVYCNILKSTIRKIDIYLIKAAVSRRHFSKLLRGNHFRRRPSNSLALRIKNRVTVASNNWHSQLKAVMWLFRFAIRPSTEYEGYERLIGCMRNKLTYCTRWASESPGSPGAFCVLSTDKSCSNG